MKRKSSSPVRHLLELVMILTVLAYLIAFARWNSEERLTFTYWSSAAPVECKVLYLVLASFLAGSVIVGVAGSFGALQSAIELRRVRKRMRLLQDEMSRLRSHPEGGAPAPRRTGQAQG